MIFLYEIVQTFLFLLFAPIIRRFGSNKAKLFIQARDNSVLEKTLEQTAKSMSTFEHLQKPEQPRRIWAHVASAGELEQAIPPLRFLVESGSASVFLTYFSPSTEPFLKNAPFVSGVAAFPLDIRQNHKKIVHALSISDIVLVRYDFWPSLFSAGKSLGVYFHLLGATSLPSRKNLAFWGGNFLKKLFFHNFSNIFCVNKDDFKFFSELNLPAKLVHSGDPKWSRAQERALAQQKKRSASQISWLFNWIQQVKSNRPVLIFGSPHKDEHFVAMEVIKKQTETFVIYVPHECDNAHVDPVMRELVSKNANAVQFSTLSQGSLPPTCDILVFDKIGHLAELYSIADIAIVGGGFDGQIHNTLEPAAYPVPTLFGNNVQKAREAQALLAVGAAASFQTPKDLLQYLLGSESSQTQKHRELRDSSLALIKARSTDLFHSIPDTCNIVHKHLKLFWTSRENKS